LAGVVLVLAALGGAGYVLATTVLKHDDRRDTVVSFVHAWQRGDKTAMYALLDRASRAAYPRVSFLARYRTSEKNAGVEKLTIGRIGPLRDGAVRVPVAVATDDFGTLKGALTFHAHDENGKGRIAWDPSLRLPGLRRGESVKRVRGPQPARGLIYAAGGALLDSDPLGASIAGTPPLAGKKATGLQRIYNSRLAGRPSLALRFGHRTIVKLPRKAARSVHTTITWGSSARRRTRWAAGWAAWP
jgi:hypothetical protein